MKAIILAAGIGSRLLPHTADLPKCLLKVANKPILEYQLDALKENGIKEVVIVIGHCGDKIKEFIASNQKFIYLNIKYIENPDYKATNSAYSLLLARDEIKDGFIYLNSDLIFHPKLLNKLLKSEYENCIIIDKETNYSNNMNKVIMNGDLIKDMGEYIHIKDAMGEAIGPVRFSQKYADLIMEKIDGAVLKGDKSQWCYWVFSDVAKEHNNFFGVNSDNLYWLEVDGPEDLKKADKIMRDRKII